MPDFVYLSVLHIGAISLWLKVLLLITFRAWVSHYWTQFVQHSGLWHRPYWSTCPVCFCPLYVRLLPNRPQRETEHWPPLNGRHCTAGVGGCWMTVASSRNTVCFVPSCKPPPYDSAVLLTAKLHTKVPVVVPDDDLMYVPIHSMEKAECQKYQDVLLHPVVFLQ